MFRRTVIFITLFVCTAVHARVLRIGDDTMQLYETKNTTPALNVKIGDEMWYGNATLCDFPISNKSNKRLNIKSGNKIYSIYDNSAKNMDYIINDGKLIWANCDIYLESTGTQYIDTGYIPTETTRSEIIFRHTDLSKKGGTFGLLEYVEPIGNPGYSRYYIRLNNDSDTWYAVGQSIRPTTKNSEKHTAILDVLNKEIIIDNAVLVQNVNVSQIGKTTRSCYMFSENQGRVLNGYNKIYSVKIFTNNIPVHHFVPVPIGLKIGDYTVPQTGMWDIVEQKFYGNSGTGEFLYGKD